LAKSRHIRPKPGSKVTLIGLPAGFLDDLPEEDQRAISEVVGRAILLRGYDEDGRAELEFAERDGTGHTIWVRPKFITEAK
jgi:hypothetical protein